MFCCLVQPDEGAESVEDKQQASAAPQAALPKATERNPAPPPEPKAETKAEPQASDVAPSKVAEDPPAKAAALEAGDKKPGKAATTVSLWKLLSLASFPELCIFFTGVMGAIITGGQNPGLIYIWGRMVDAVGGTAGVNMDDQVIIMCLFGLCVFAAASLESCCFRTFAQMQANKMRKNYYAAILSKDICWFDARTPAALPQELNSDVESYCEALGDKLGQGVQGLSGFVISIILGFVLGWKLALAVLASVPLMLVGVVILGKAVQEVTQESQSWYSKAAAIVEETLFAIRTVVSLGGERREIDRYSGAVKKAQVLARRNEYKIAVGMGWTKAVFAECTAGAFYLGMTFLYDGEINNSTGRVWTGGDILIVFFIVLMAGFMLGQCDPMFKALNEGKIAMARYLSVVNAPCTIEVRGVDMRKPVTNFEGFEFQDVHFAYAMRPDIHVLKGISFKIEKGTKVAFVGESGSGKSTVMSLLERFYDPTQGSVLVNGEDLRNFSPASLRAIIGYVGQEPVLFTTTVRNNIMQGWPGATEGDLKKALQVAQVNFVDQLPQGLDTFVGSGGSQFSGGQKQRLAIARAMLRKPKVLFLDEATSALDSRSEALIQETLDHISKEGIDGHPLTTVAIAHRLKTVENSDCIYVLKSGVIMEKGTHAFLTKKNGGIYQALAATQAMKIAGSDGAQGPFSPEESLSPKANEALTTARSGNIVQEQAAEGKIVNNTEKRGAASFRRLLQFNRPEWPCYFPGILAALLQGACTPFQGYLMVAVLDSLYAGKEEMKEEVTKTVIYFAILGLVLFISTATNQSMFGILGESLTARLRIALMTNIFRQEVGFHDNPDHTPALLGTGLQLWAYRVKNFNSAVGAITEVIGSFICGLLIAFFGNWRMALVTMCAIPVLGVASTIKFKFQLGGTTLANDNMKFAQQVVSDSVQNTRTVHAIGAAKSLLDTYEERVTRASRGFVPKAAIAGMAYGFSLCAPCFVMAGGYTYADYLMKHGMADFKGVMMAFLGILYAGMSMGHSAARLGDMAKAKEANKGIFRLLDQKSAIDGLDPVGKVPDWATTKRRQAGNIEFRDVGFAYPFRPEVTVLSSVSFEVKAGTSVGLVGPSGGGKSTIMALVQRFYDPLSGTVLIGEAKTPLSSIDIRWWRKQIGFVGQEPILFNTSVKENVLYSIDTEGGETVDEARYNECKKMARVDFNDTIAVGPRGSQLSGGQKQRVAICRALIRDPPILLFDEATSALDSESEKLVQQALEAVRVGRTSITIAHRLSTIQDSDKILVAGNGTILESGTHDELVKLGNVYYKLWAGGEAPK